jgi:hypothetical protein
MRIRTDDLYKCDGCGKEQLNPQGWSYLLPLIGDSRTDHRLGSRDDFCSECAYAFKGFLKVRRSEPGAQSR